MKKWIAKVLAFTSCVMVCCASLAFSGCGEPVKYALNLDGKSYMVTESKNAKGEVVIDATYKGLPVTEIAYNAFTDCTKLTSVVIPEGITTINSGAFKGCTALENVSIPATVKNVYANAFAGCTSLLKTEDGVIYAANWAVKNNSESAEVVLKEGTQGIAHYSFYENLTLTKIVIPASVRNISYQAFTNCRELLSVQFEENSQLDYIGQFAFNACWKIESFSLPSSVTTLDNYSLSYSFNTDKLSEFTIPASVNYIGEGAFGTTGFSKIIFENTTGWTVGGEAFDVSNPANNAKKLDNDKPVCVRK